ncbi:MAG: hypothetical protein Kow0029_15530 [Candidatus Rifleibacteriota bacterium]
MGALFVLTGTIMLMMSAIWIIGEVLKTDVIMGALALFFFPIFSIYWTFFVDYKRCNVPFFIGLGGALFVLIGMGIGIS